VSSEGSGSTSRGKAVGATFAMQGVGNLLASLTMFILLSSDLDLDWVWRIALGAGAVPGLLTVRGRGRRRCCVRHYGDT
jgi:MFS family permease